MSYRGTEHLGVLIANERKDRLALVAPIVVAQEHEVVAPKTASAATKAAIKARVIPSRPDRACARHHRRA